MPFVNRPLPQSQNGGNAIPNSNANANSPNFFQHAAQVAQANRTSSRFPTRSIDYPYNSGYQSVAYRNLIAQSPAPYYPTYPTPSYNPNTYYASNPPGTGANGAAQVMPNAMQNMASSPTSGNSMAPNNTTHTIVIPAVPLRPNMSTNPNAMASSSGYGLNGNQNYGVTSNPPSQPLSPWTSFASGTGSLFRSSLFSNNSNTNYVASNTPVTQPYLWGNNNPSGMSSQPNMSPNVATQPSWGIPPNASYRDPMQGGMPATVLR